MKIDYSITQSRLLYVYSIEDKKHDGYLKIGEVFVNNDVAKDSLSSEDAVKGILKHRAYMNGVAFELKLVECTTWGDKYMFKADDIHRTLEGEGVPKKYFAKDSNKEDADIWFKCLVKDVQSAIKTTKQLIENPKQSAEAGGQKIKIKFRPEQRKAIKDTVAYFKKKTGKQFLWNAKMRFGKTLSGLQVAKELGYKSVLIVTHRPVVDKGWSEDFDKIFPFPFVDESGEDSKGLQIPNFYYATRMEVDADKTQSPPKNHVDNIDYNEFCQLTKAVDKNEKGLVLFVSMQYLRLSQFVGGKEKSPDPLKKAIMQYDWDFVMVDEAHEGIEAPAGYRVMEKLRKEHTRILSLSGTPFNLLDKFEEDSIFTWDYVMEQKAKREWDDKHFGDPNPYAELPQMQILTFTMDKVVRDYKIQNGETFKFHEFFRVWKDEDKDFYEKNYSAETDPRIKSELKAQLDNIIVGNFVHEKEVKAFLDKLAYKSDDSLYPFSNEDFRDKFRHTFWLVPGVKEGKALEELLKHHNPFDSFEIVNVAGDGNIEDIGGKALDKVRHAIDESNKKRTITISCGKLTTGVTVPEWTAVLCLSGSNNTPAANYMQTIFRVQTHAVLNGRQKRNCYVFDFAPDRALTAVAEASKMSVIAQNGKNSQRLKLSQKAEEEYMGEFVKLCPVISMDEGKMGTAFSANNIFEKLSNVYIERAVRSGYSDNSLYDPEKLLNLTPEQEKTLGDVRDLIGAIPGFKIEKVTINSNGLCDDLEAEDVKYVYYLTEYNAVPTFRYPIKGGVGDDGRPVVEDPNWVEEMPQVDEEYRYCFVSHSKKVGGDWTSFSTPKLWKEYKEPSEKPSSKKDKEYEEKRARISVLRGVAIRIPLLVYGADINDDKEEITIDNFASEQIVDQASWDEYMPKGFTKETFDILKDCFDRSIFSGAAKRIRQMVKEADSLNTEDRIAKIATIFSYFHNPDKETVLTPWRVVNMHMSDTVGGYCFMNEEFDGPYMEENKYHEMIQSTRKVEIEEVTEKIFGDYNARILEINSKTGLYPLYMAYSMFKYKEPEWRKMNLTHARGQSTNAEEYNSQVYDDLEIWKDVLQDNIFVICRTKMAASITRRTLAGFRKDIRLNVKCYTREIEVSKLLKKGVLNENDDRVTLVNNEYLYDGENCKECDLIDVLRVAPELFINEVVQIGSFWNVYSGFPKTENEKNNKMKFNVVVGNPPYQLNIEGRSEQPPVYHLFYDAAIDLSDRASLITPARFLFDNGKTPHKWNVKMLSDSHFRVVNYFDSSKLVFDNVDIKGGVAITYRDNNIEYGPIGEFFATKEIVQILAKIDWTNNISKLVHSSTIFKYSQLFTMEHPEMIDRVNGGSRKYIHSKAPEVMSEVFLRENPKDGYKYARILGKLGEEREYFYFREDYIKLPDNYNKYKVIVASSNGTGKFGEKLSSPFVAEPGVGSTETFMSLGCFNTREEACNLLKYLKTRFFRALLGSKKATQGNKSAYIWSKIPIQDFTSSSDIDWSRSIDQIDEDLFNKYSLKDEDKVFIRSRVEPMD